MVGNFVLGEYLVGGYGVVENMVLVKFGGGNCFVFV